MIHDSFHSYRAFMKLLLFDNVTPPDVYGKYLQTKKRRKFKPRNKDRK